MERREVTELGTDKWSQGPQAEPAEKVKNGVWDGEGDLQLSSPWSAAGKASDPEHGASVRISGHCVVLRYRYCGKDPNALSFLLHSRCRAILRPRG